MIDELFQKIFEPQKKIPVQDVNDSDTARERPRKRHRTEKNVEKKMGADEEARLRETVSTDFPWNC